METKKRSYSTEFKIRAVELSNHRRNVSQVSIELGVGDNILRRWIREYKNGQFVQGDKKVISKEEEELRRLKKELYEIKLERDILKKAVGIFSKNDR